MYSAPLRVVGCQVQCPRGWAVSLSDPGIHHRKPATHRYRPRHSGSAFPVVKTPVLSI